MQIIKLQVYKFDWRAWNVKMSNSLRDKTKGIILQYHQHRNISL